LNIYEIDWRFSSTSRIFQALSDGLENVARDFREAQESSEEFYDVDEAVEHVESLLGIAFVTAQTYIAGTVSDASKITRSTFKKDQLLKDFSDRLSGSEVTKLELCDSIANYFKHHDEWTSTSATNRNQKTVFVLRAAGIQEDDTSPCRKAADILWSNNDGSDLKPLLLLISNWRKAVIEACKR
jgi:hypothetical protein